MKILIIEDEKPAYKQLVAMIRRQYPSAEIFQQIDTVRQAVTWFSQFPPPDLVFMDIQLADGVSFDIFAQVDIRTPIIFTTAYDQYAIQAFKVNSIDYLLKPIDQIQLTSALEKYQSYYSKESKLSSEQLFQIQQAIGQMSKSYKSRFVMKVGEHIKAISTDEILYFYSQEKMTYLQTAQKHYIIDYTLDQVEELIDPQQFFRINRKYIIRLDAILDMITYTNSRLRIKLKYCNDPEILVSRERVAGFKQWLDH